MVRLVKTRKGMISDIGLIVLPQERVPSAGSKWNKEQIRIGGRRARQQQQPISDAFLAISVDSWKDSVNH